MKISFPQALSAVLLSLAACLALSSCPNPMLSVAGEDGGETASGDGLVRFRFSMQEDFPASKALSGGISRTVWPNDDSSFFLVNYYRVRAVGPRQAYVDRTIYTTSREISVDGFMPGSWQIAVEACNHNDTVVAAASTYISIGSGEVPSINMALVSRLDPNQDGNLWIDISLPVALAGPVLSGSLTRLKPAGGGAEDLSPWLLLSMNPSGCHTPLRACPAGAYRLDLTLTATVSSVPGVTVWGVSEIIYVVQGHTSCYRATLTSNELMAGPYDPYISLSSGVVVESGGVGTEVEVYCDTNAVNIYTLDGSVPTYDAYQRNAINGTVCGSYTLLELGSALDADSDGLITLTVQSFNDWGQSTPFQRVYYLSDALYVDVNDTGSALRGTPRDPFTTIATANSRILDLGRQAMTTIRTARGLYMENPNPRIRTGTVLSGSYTHVAGTDSWTRDDLSLSFPDTYDDANATVITGSPIYDTGSEAAPHATVSVTPGLSMEARLEYLSIEGPQAGAGYTGCYLAALSASYIYGDALVMDHLRLRGNAQAANMSYGLQAYYAYDLRSQACVISGRETAGASGLHSIGVDLAYSGLTDSGSSISSGNGNLSGWSYGIRVPWANANSFISLSNSMVEGNASNSYVSATLGINSYGGSDLTVGPGCKIDSGLGDYAIAIKTYDCDLDVRGSRVASTGGPGSGGSYGIYCSLSSSNPGTTVTISGNPLISAGETDTGASTGLHIDASNLISTILIEGNKISGGAAPLSTSLNGFTFSESGSGTGTLVLRNNIIYRGEGAANGVGASIEQQLPTAGIAAFLANNDFISFSYMPPSPALFLGGYIQPYLINNIFVAAHGGDYCVLHASTAGPLATLNNEFFSYGHDYAEAGIFTTTPPNSLPNSGGNVSFGMGSSLFTGSGTGNGGAPLDMTQFIAFSGILHPSSPPAVQTGARDLSLAANLPTAFAAYAFDADFDGGAARDDPWSMGAVEH